MVFMKSRQLRSAFPIRFQIMPSILRVAAVVACKCSLVIREEFCARAATSFVGAVKIKVVKLDTERV